MKHLSSVGLIGLFLLLPFLPFQKVSVFAAVVINEIFPKTENASTQWIELYNTSPEQVSLDRWKLQNAKATPNTFTMNASFIIPANGYLTFYGSQTGLALNAEGDTVRLIDANNNVIDNQDYPGILGYNTSIGRSVDGGGAWVTCSPMPPYAATPNQSNNCPSPTPTTTPLPTPIATNTPTPTPFPTRIPTPTRMPTTIVTSASTTPNILGRTTEPSPIPPATEEPTTIPVDFMQTEQYRTLWLTVIVEGIGLGLIILCIGLYRSYKQRHRKTSQ